MKRRTWPALLGGILWWVVGSCGSLSNDRPPALEEPIHVLILGDSISMGYTNEVRRLLGERAVVVRPTRADNGKPENCAGTNNGVVQLDRWLAQDGGDWDVIHFNFGLHDLKRVNADTGKNSNDPSDPQQAPPDRYEVQLRDIVARLQATGARLVFATTTPVPEGDLRPYRAPEDAVQYNEIAVRVMSEAGVPINDLHAFALSRLAEIQQPENVHFSKEGSAVLATAVVAAILEVAGLAPLE
jgi:acyl-CoA thioesterase-1